jgi:hypothetical protein
MGEGVRGAAWTSHFKPHKRRRSSSTTRGVKPMPTNGIAFLAVSVSGVGSRQYVLGVLSAGPDPRPGSVLLAPIRH